jgi:hypothetical protein
MGRRTAVIVDMDGTLCDVSTVMHLQAEPDGFHAFHQACAQCPPHSSVVAWCIDQHSQGHAIVIVTGRDAYSRELTTRWLAEHLPVPVEGLHMRREGDFRSNPTIKRAISRDLLAEYDIVAAIDDDPDIVALWHEFGISVSMVLEQGEVLDLSTDLNLRRSK